MTKYFFAALLLFQISCSDDSLKRKELELKEREIALQEKKQYSDSLEKVHNLPLDYSKEIIGKWKILKDDKVYEAVFSPDRVQLNLHDDFRNDQPLIGDYTVVGSVVNIHIEGINFRTLRIVKIDNKFYLQVQGMNVFARI